jgi:hypothetical protein
MPFKKNLVGLVSSKQMMLENCKESQMIEFKQF